jgi:hypothetical protein
MGKTNRVYLDKMCHKAKSMEHGQKQHKSLIDDLNKEQNLNINRCTNLPETWDDDMISSLDETKTIWKNGLEIEPEDGFFNIFFQKKFIVNLTSGELKKFPWTKLLPIDTPPNLAKFELV